MFEQDYLMRMIMQLIEAIVRSMQLAEGEEEDPAAAADLLEQAIGSATEIDGATLLSLSPDSIATILDVSGTDPRVAEYVGRSLHLASQYHDQCGRTHLSAVREEQAQALARAYGFSLEPELTAADSMEAFLNSEKESAEESESDGAPEAECGDNDTV